MDRVRNRPRLRARPPRVLLLIESSRSSGRGLLRGIADYARLHGPWEFYWEPGGFENAWPKIRDLAVTGIILRDVERLQEVLDHGVPAVVVGHRRREIPGLANVITDSDCIAQLAAAHLAGCGLHHFAYCGLEGLPWSTLRGEAFARHVAAFGGRVHPYTRPATQAAAEWKNERRYLADWLTAMPKPLGLMACNDDRGEQVVEACKLAGLPVPDAVAILGADNDELVCDLCDPPMSSVAINFERAGFEAAEVLDRLMRGESLADDKILVRATHVVTRRSTDILAVDDPRLAAALRYLREHVHELISVPDLARAAGLSRRVLEKRFQRVLRRSALQEIRRVRIGHICQMLAETSEPVARIALAFGYSGPEHLARYFRREMRMTPLAYRQDYGRR